MASFVRERYIHRLRPISFLRWEWQDAAPFHSEIAIIVTNSVKDEAGRNASSCLFCLVLCNCRGISQAGDPGKVG